MRAFYLVIFPVLFLVATGFIYANYAAWNTVCGGDITCQVNPTSNVETTDPLFAIMSGNITNVFSALDTTLWVSGDAYNVTVPWFGTVTQATIPEFTLPNPSRTTYDITNVPWFSVSTYTLSIGSIGGGTTVIPGNTFWNWGASDWTFYWPSFDPPDFSIPWIAATTKTITVPWIDFGTPIAVCDNNSCQIPWVSSTTYELSLGVPSWSLIGITIGIFMILLSITALANAQGSKTLTVIGFGIVMWNFTSAVVGTWMTLLPSGIGTILNGLLELVFVLGIYWQTQSEM